MLKEFRDTTSAERLSSTVATAARVPWRDRQPILTPSP
jgi:hypothetical protein